jgi:hypothetical protein
MYWIKRLWDPAVYQGAGKKKRYFEGWYFKHVSPDGRVFAVIPGVAMSADGLDKHAFIQTIDGNSAQTNYVAYPFEEFDFRKDRFTVTIGLNRFSSDEIEVDLGEKGVRFRAKCEYHNPRGFAFSLINPNAMGWYSFVPFMECYHGLVSMDHRIEGYFDVEGEYYTFDRGRGYIEKDWGRSFPSSWVWTQTNCFTRTGDSFMLSIARIPWCGSYFVGFLGFLSISGQTYKFATYTGAHICHLKITESRVEVEIDAGKYSIEVAGVKKRKGLLQAPRNGVMERRILESIDAEIAVQLRAKKGDLLFSDTGTSGGLEIVGDPKELTADI